VLPGEWLVQGAEKGAKLIRHYGVNVHGEQFVRLAFEFAAAYASVKVTLLLRILTVGFVACESGFECLVDTLVCSGIYYSVVGTV
jgi:hypothetical protein